MQEFLNKLYSYEYFGIYLIISIVVLILLFILIFIFGKKDQKQREKTATLKLQQINEEAFKEEMTEEKLEVKKEEEKLEVKKEEEKLENDTIIVPTIEDLPVINNVEEEIPESARLEVEEQEKFVEEIINPEIKEEQIIQEENFVIEEVEEPVITPLLSKQEESPFVFAKETQEIKDIKIETIKEEIPELKEEKVELDVPEFNFDEVVKDIEETKKVESYSRGPQIFSSVYVPERKEEVKDEVKVIPEEEELEFELPTLKKAEPKEKVNEPKEEPIVQEEKNEELIMPVLNDYNLDNLSGEIYTINK